MLLLKSLAKGRPLSLFDFRKISAERCNISRQDSVPLFERQSDGLGQILSVKLELTR